MITKTSYDFSHKIDLYVNPYIHKGISKAKWMRQYALRNLDKYIIKPVVEKDVEKKNDQ